MTTNPTTTTSATTAQDSSETGVVPTTGGTSTSTSTSTSTDDSSDSANFAVTVGDEGVPCDPFMPDCPEGEKCAPSLNKPYHQCIPVTGDGTIGDPCTTKGLGVDDCAKGHMCRTPNLDINTGYCVEHCIGTSDDAICTTDVPCLENVWTPEPVFICPLACDPLLQDCPPTDGCLALGPSFLCYEDFSELMVGDPCEFINACPKGSACVPIAEAPEQCDAEASGCCLPFCEFPDDPNCPENTECTQYYNPMQGIPPGKENIGLCKAPG